MALCTSLQFGTVTGTVQRGPPAAVPRRRTQRPQPAPSVRRTLVRPMLAGGAPVRSPRFRFAAPFMAVALLGSLIPAAARAAPSVPVTFTILHTNDFHGQLEEVLASPSTSSNHAMGVSYT